MKLTLALAAVAVPINTLFGISVALLIARNEFKGTLRLFAYCFPLSLLDSLWAIRFSLNHLSGPVQFCFLYGA